MAENFMELSPATPPHVRLYRGAAAIALTAVALFSVGEVSQQLGERDGRIARAEADLTAATADTGEKAAQIDQLTQGLLAQQQRLERLEKIAGNLSGVEPELLSGALLGKVSELPGYGQEVDPALAERLRSATVRTLRSEKPSAENPTGGAWNFNCTGLKIGSGSDAYVVTARHCMTTGDPAFSKGGPLYLNGQDTAFNIIDTLTSQYAVRQDDGRAPEGESVPASAIAMSTAVDYALIKVDQTSPQAASFNAADSFVDYADGLRQPAFLAQPGEATAVFSLPGRGPAEGVVGKGIYLGTIPDPSDTSRQLELVGLPNIEFPREDACNYGASGSTAVSASGKLFGPLAMRNNIYYAPEAFQNEGDDLQYAAGYRLKLEAALNLNLDEFDTICGYSVVTPEIFEQTVHGFDVAAPASTVPSAVQGK